MAMVQKRNILCCIVDPQEMGLNAEETPIITVQYNPDETLDNVLGVVDSFFSTMLPTPKKVVGIHYFVENLMIGENHKMRDYPCSEHVALRLIMEEKK